MTHSSEPLEQPSIEQLIAEFGAELDIESKWEGLLEAGLVSWQDFLTMQTAPTVPVKSQAEMQADYARLKAQSLLACQLSITT
jgi:hypothetical protein